jgi:hypothetical protein
VVLAGVGPGSGVDTVVGKVALQLHFRGHSKCTFAVELLFAVVGVVVDGVLLRYSHQETCYVASSGLLLEVFPFFGSVGGGGIRLRLSRARQRS